MRREALYILGHAWVQKLNPGKISNGAEHLYQQLDHWFGAKIGMFSASAVFALCAMQNAFNAGIILASVVSLGLTWLISPSTPSNFSIDEKLVAKEWTEYRRVLAGTSEFQAFCRFLGTVPAGSNVTDRSQQYWDCVNLMQTIHGHRSGLRAILR